MLAVVVDAPGVRRRGDEAVERRAVVDVARVAVPDLASTTGWRSAWYSRHAAGRVERVAAQELGGLLGGRAGAAVLAARSTARAAGAWGSRGRSASSAGPSGRRGRARCAAGRRSRGWSSTRLRKRRSSSRARGANHSRGTGRPGRRRCPRRPRSGAARRAGRRRRRRRRAPASWRGASSTLKADTSTPTEGQPKRRALHERRAAAGERVEDALAGREVALQERLDELRHVLAEVRVQPVDVLRALVLGQLALAPRQLGVDAGGERRPVDRLLRGHEPRG